MLCVKLQEQLLYIGFEILTSKITACNQNKSAVAYTKKFANVTSSTPLGYKVAKLCNHKKLLRNLANKETRIKNFFSFENGFEMIFNMHICIYRYVYV